jgi:hypothetical protein
MIREGGGVAAAFGDLAGLALDAIAVAEALVRCIDHTHMTLRDRGELVGFARMTAPVVAAAMRRATAKDLARLKRILESS